MAKTVLGECRFCNSRAVFSTKSIALEWQAEPGIEVREMREPLGELVAQACVRDELSITFALVAANKRSNE